MHDNMKSLRDANSMPKINDRDPSDKEIRIVPDGYERLTLAGKMIYASKIGKTVFDPVLRYKSGAFVAVAADNAPLQETKQGFDVDKRI